MLISMKMIIFYYNLVSSKFARNIGLQFKTPEMFFYEAKEKLPAFSFDPKIAFKKTGSVFKGKHVKPEEIPSKNKECKI